VLAALEVAPLGDASAADRTDYLIHVFTREALDCERRSSRGQRARTIDGTSSLQEPRKLRDVSPVYPKQLIAARIQGNVIIEAVIDRIGCVNRAAVLNEARPDFSIAALAAIAQWRYTPTLLNGEPVPVIMTITSTFSLQ
jgi:TonB family protein